MAATAAIGAASLSLRELESFDPRAARGGRERRFLCPRCGQEKPKDGGHRSMAVNTETGAFLCHRCGASGVLVERQREQPEHPSGRARVRPRFRPTPLRDEDAPPDHERQLQLRSRLRSLQPLAGSPGEAYLASRGIPLAVAAAGQVRFSPDWYGRPAVVFPVRDRSGALVAVQGRHTDGRDNPKCHDAGEKARGVFLSRPDALTVDPLVLVEAPIDALSIEAWYGLAAAATLGKQLPAWVPRLAAFREVLIATDADAGGEEAFRTWCAALQALGARCSRWPPPEGKDWNDALRACDGAARRKE